MYEPILLACNKLSRNVCFLRVCPISTTAARNIVQDYRKKKGLPMNPNAYGPLTDLPDYSYLDGRPVPLGMRQMKRITKQKEIVQKIISLSKEIDFAVERHEDKQKTEQESKEAILKNRLEQKGYLLLNDKKWGVQK